MSKTFRIFVSSTFEDLKAERNALRESVFPRLRDLCVRQGAQFQAIDLRWGISTEASLDQRTIPICLEEIQRCQHLSPRMNFLVLLGDRYGSRLLPPAIPEGEFHDICAHLSTEDSALLTQWYPKDRNAAYPRPDGGGVEAEHCLSYRTGEYADPESWDPVERRLGDMLERGALAAGFSGAALAKYQHSVTHQEIHRGVLDGPAPNGHVLAFFRTIRDLDAVIASSPTRRASSSSAT
jgi:hypothetical protein